MREDLRSCSPGRTIACRIQPALVGGSLNTSKYSTLFQKVSWLQLLARPVFLASLQMRTPTSAHVLHSMSDIGCWTPSVSHMGCMHACIPSASLLHSMLYRVGPWLVRGPRSDPDEVSYREKTKQAALAKNSAAGMTYMTFLILGVGHNAFTFR